MSEDGSAAPPPKKKPTAAQLKPGLHPRNRDLAGYDFPALVAASPGLARYLVTTPAGSTSIDFASSVMIGDRETDEHGVAGGWLERSSERQSGQRQTGDRGGRPRDPPGPPGDAPDVHPPHTR